MTATELAGIIRARRHQTPLPEDYVNLRRRIAAHLRIALTSFEADAWPSMPVLVRRATSESWDTIRRRVWHRDGPICHVCTFGITGDDYECGHIVDRCAGGADRDSNLVAMHTHCNRIKPTHGSHDEYRAWTDDVVMAAAKAWRASA